MLRKLLLPEEKKTTSTNIVKNLKTFDKDDIREDDLEENVMNFMLPKTTLLNKVTKKAVKTPVKISEKQQAINPHAKGRGSQVADVKGGKKKKETLEETARKPNLRKIKSFFEQKTTGGNEALTENENLKTSSSIEGGVGVTWAVTTGTVQCETEFCVDQSEGVAGNGLMNHLGFGRTEPYDWRAGGSRDINRRT